MFNDRLMALYWAINPPKSIQMKFNETLERRMLEPDILASDVKSSERQWCINSDYINII